MVTWIQPNVPLIKHWKVDPRDSQANMMMGVLLQQEGSKPNLEKADALF